MGGLIHARDQQDTGTDGVDWQPDGRLPVTGFWTCPVECSAHNGSHGNASLSLPFRQATISNDPSVGIRFAGKMACRNYKVVIAGCWIYIFPPPSFSW